MENVPKKRTKLEKCLADNIHKKRKERFKSCEAFARAITEKREEAGFVAETRINRTTVQRWEDRSEKGRLPTVSQLFLIAEVLGTTIDYLFTGVSSDNKQIVKETGLSNDAMNYLRQSSLFRESQNWTREKWKAFPESYSNGDELRKSLDSAKFVTAINNAVAHNLTDLIIDLVNYIVQDHEISEELLSSLRKSVFKGMRSNFLEQEGDKTVIYLEKIPIAAFDVIDKDFLDRLAFDALEKKIIVTKDHMKESDSNGKR